jgi:acetoacetyl-CoA synthetase
MGPEAHFVIPATPLMDEAVADVWERTLGVSAHRNDRLLDILIGVHRRAPGLLGVLIDGIGNATGVHLPLTVVFSSPTAAELSDMVRHRDWPQYVRPVKVHNGFGRPLFFLPGLGGNGLDTLGLIRHLTVTGPIYLNPSRGIDGAEPHHSLDAAVADQISIIKTVQPKGPYQLLGYSWGGLVALEVARSLRASGETIAFVGMIEPVLNVSDWTYGAWLGFMANRIGHHLRQARQAGSPRASLHYVQRQLVPAIDKFVRLFGVYQLWPLDSEAERLSPPLAAIWKAESDIIKRYRLRFYDGAATLFATQFGHAAECNPAKIWPTKVSQLDLQWIPGDHFLTGPAVENMAAIISTAIATAQSNC